MLRVLHIEDDPADAELIYAAVTAHACCQFSCVASRAGLEAALTHEVFDVIVSDSSLPGFDGAAALRLAKRKFPAVPFVFCSGSLVGEKQKLMRDHGATDFFSKDDPSGLIRFIIDLEANLT